LFLFARPPSCAPFTHMVTSAVTAPLQPLPTTPSSFHASISLPLFVPSHRRFATPLFSYSYESLFPQPLYFHIHPHRPGGVPLRRVPSGLCPGPVSKCLRGKSHVVSGLRTLLRSWLSFSRWFPLFSTACSLFCQKQGGCIPRSTRVRRQSSSSRYTPPTQLHLQELPE
jgi:hypothetical protein